MFHCDVLCLLNFTEHDVPFLNFPNLNESYISIFYMNVLIIFFKKLTFSEFFIIMFCNKTFLRRLKFKIFMKVTYIEFCWIYSLLFIKFCWKLYIFLGFIFYFMSFIFNKKNKFYSFWFTKKERKIKKDGFGLGGKVSQVDFWLNQGIAKGEWSVLLTIDGDRAHL